MNKPFIDLDETHEEQVFRVLKEMIENGEVSISHDSNGEPLFSLSEQNTFE